MGVDDTGCLETRTCFMWMRDDGIIETRIKAGARQNIFDGRENLDGEKKLAGGTMAPLLKDYTEIGGIDKACRDFYASDEVASVHTACAILVQSKLSRAIGSFFLGMSKPKTPTRLFIDRESAIGWLRTHMDTRQNGSPRRSPTGYSPTG